MIRFWNHSDQCGAYQKGIFKKYFDLFLVFIRQPSTMAYKLLDTQDVNASFSQIVLALFSSSFSKPVSEVSSDKIHFTSILLSMRYGYRSSITPTLFLMGDY